MAEQSDDAAGSGKAAGSGNATGLGDAAGLGNAAPSGKAARPGDGGQAETIDEYIATFPDEVQGTLQEVRRRVHAVAPGVVETVSYGMPTMMLDGRRFVYFAAWKHHVAMYAIPKFDGALERDVASHRAAKDTLQFPFGRDTPYDLIERIVAELLARHAQGAR